MVGLAGALAGALLTRAHGATGVGAEEHGPRNAAAAGARDVEHRIGAGGTEAGASVGPAPVRAGATRAAAQSGARSAAAAGSSGSSAAVPWPAQVSWLAAGGGPAPEHNPVSVEDDLALVAETLGPERGVLLFAGGPGTRSVQVLDPERRGDALEARLADFFDGRGGRDAHYRATRLPLQGAASSDAVLGAVERAFTAGSGPLLLFLAGHGAPGDAPSATALLTWGEGELRPADLAAVLDKAPPERPVRVVVTSCYSGGFGDLVFRGADPEKGPAPGDRCGFFAAPWDMQASGCDPDPDRAKHEGYALHFLNALRGRDRDGEDALAELDLDGDGRVSLLEAHTRAVIASTSLDVPTTTSEAWLRAVAPASGPSQRVALPEFEAVARAMSQRVALRGDETNARAELAQRNAAIAAQEEFVVRLDEDADRAYRAASAALLSRWPVIDDPWHPDYRATLDADRLEIQAFFDGAPELLAWRAARARLEEAELRLDDLRIEAAPYERMVRALEDLALAGRLRAKGGDGWARFERLLACERGAPP